MFRRRDRVRVVLMELIERFREKKAISPESALTAEELSLPSRFKEAMNRNLGRSGVFVEVNGKYYLSEEKLREVKDRIAERRK